MKERPERVVEVETVCGGRLLADEQTPSAVHRGKRVYFCTRACLRAFREARDAFMAGEIEHPES